MLVALDQTLTVKNGIWAVGPIILASAASQPVPAGQLARVILPELIFVNHDDQHVRYDPEPAPPTPVPRGGWGGIKQTSTSTPSIRADKKPSPRKHRVDASLGIAFLINFLECKRLQKQS